jgi:hypothetical protein
MYSNCLFCHAHLGSNAVLPTFPVGVRLAYDRERGRLWVVCSLCRRWNLSALEERWEAIEECERRFRATPLRAFTPNIGLARLPDGLEVVRIGRALPGEIAAWRYGRGLLGECWSWQRSLLNRLEDGAVRAGEAATTLLRRLARYRIRTDLLTALRIRTRAHRVLAVVPLESGDAAVIRFRHLEAVELLRPERQENWRLRLGHEAGSVVVSSDAGLRTAAKLLAALNGRGATSEHVRGAMSKLEDAGRPEGYFSRVTALALRTSWGRDPDAPSHLPTLPEHVSTAERLALQLTNRSFWGRGGTGSEPATPLLQLPLVDRLALEMAASEEVERRALDGELAELEAAWREAEEIAAIADALLPPPPAADLAAGLPAPA